MFFTFKKKKVPEDPSKFLTNDLRKVIMDKSHLRKKFIQNGNRENWYEYKKLRTGIKIKS